MANRNLSVAGIAATALAAQLPGMLCMHTSRAATTDNDTLEEVVVVAQKRSENLQKVPISVDVVSGSSLEASGITNTTQLEQVVPGISTRITYNQIEPTIRGVGTSAAGPGVENSVALYVDDVYYASQVATAFSLVDVEQVAVLKGPQGTLFGRNTTGGVIQVTTRDPQHENQEFIRTSFDNYQTSTTDFYVTGGLSDQLAASFTGRYSAQGKGWGTDVALDHQTHKVDSDADGKVKFLFTPGTDTTVKFTGDYSVRNDSLGPNFRPALPQFTTSALPGYINTSNPYDSDSLTLNNNRFISGGASLHVEQNLQWARLVDIVGYRFDHLVTQFDPSASPTPGNDIDIDESTNQVTEELRLVSPESSSLTWQTGVFYFHGYGKDDPLGVHIRPALSGGPDLLIDIRTREGTTSFAGYAQATKALNDTTNLTMGVRYSWERRTFAESQELFVFGNSTGLLPGTGLPPEQTYHKPTWRIALDHKLSDNVMGYVSYNRGFKSGGYNPHAPTNQPFNPETLDAYEIGIKSQWLNDRLRANAAAFFYNYDNVQVAKYTTTSLVYNGAKARIYGLDVDLKAKLTPEIELTTGFEWLHARYTEFPSAPFSVPVPDGGPQLYYASAAGNALNNAPNATATLALDYLPHVSLGALDLNLTASYSSEFFQEPDNYLVQPSYTLLNTAVAWTTPNGRLTTKLYADNLLDKAVATQLNTLPVPPIGYDVDYANPPRIYGIAVSYRF